MTEVNEIEEGGVANGYPLFSHIKNPSLRAWNRINVIFNMKQLIGEGASSEYIRNFDRFDQTSILIMSNQIEARGYNTIRKEVMESREDL